MGPNITCRALVLKTADPAQSMYIGNLSKQMWALITYIGPGPEVLSSDRPTIYNHASRRSFPNQSLNLKTTMILLDLF